jgi:hypothetical protein
VVGKGHVSEWEHCVGREVGVVMACKGQSMGQTRRVQARQLWTAGRKGAEVRVLGSSGCCRGALSAGGWAQGLLAVAGTRRVVASFCLLPILPAACLSVAGAAGGTTWVHHGVASAAGAAVPSCRGLACMRLAMLMMLVLWSGPASFPRILNSSVNTVLRWTNLGARQGGSSE